jgi:hypothetical protein
MPPESITDDDLVDLLQRYLRILQGHPTAEAMMDEILTQDFETGFVGGHVWSGLDGLRDFLSQRDGFFDENHVIEELLERRPADGDTEAHTRLHFFLRRWEAPSPVSEEFTGKCFHAWRVREVGGLAGGRADGRALRRPERELRAPVRDPGGGPEPLKAHGLGPVREPRRRAHDRAPRQAGRVPAKHSAAAACRLPAAGRFSPPARVGAPLAGSGEGSRAGAQL